MRFGTDRPARAVRFYYLVKTSHGSRIGKRPTFGVSTTTAPRINLLRIEHELSDAHLRLARVVVENGHSSAGSAPRGNDGN
jgi:DNA adenine methylase